MSSPHYFSPADPEGGARREIGVQLRGRGVRALTAPGVFSTSRLDPGTAVLLDAVPPPPPEGELLDLGCGWGPIALSLALEAPDARVWALDVNPRALALTEANAQRLGLANVVTSTPKALAAREFRFAAIWSNPPIRVGKPVLHAMLALWLPRLAPGAQAHLVVGRNLGSDSLQRWISAELAMPVERVSSARGFRVLAISQPD